MKKILMILVVLPFIFASCSDDDDDILKSDIVGTWVQESVVPKEVKTNNEVATKAIKDDIISYNQNNTEMFVFSDDGKITLIYDDGDYTEGTYSLSGNKLTMSILGESNSTYINFSTYINLSGNTFKSDIDETEFYQEAIEYLIENSNDVVVSKVITTYTYKRK